MSKLDKILSIPKTLLFNFYYLPFTDAVKLPIKVSRKVKIGSMGGRKSLQLKNKQAKISIGFEGSFGLGGVLDTGKLGKRRLYHLKAPLCLVEESNSCAMA